jgi:hypothetical protein
MDMLWKSQVHSRFRVDVPNVVIRYDPAALDSWKAAYKGWVESGRQDYAVWGEYRSLAEAERLYVPTRTIPTAARFTEFHTALLLEREGFVCWGGVHLFRYGKDVVTGQENTRAVRALWRKTMRGPWPSQVTQTLDLPDRARPRNPDIVAYHQGRKEWRFCEAKGDDPVDPNQIRALAILHLLTGAPVAVVRLVPSGRQVKSPKRSHEAKLAYRDETPPDWILRSFGEREV